MQTQSKFQDATPLLNDAEALRQRMDTDGFVYFRGLISRATVLELRRQILEVCQKYGWIASDTDLMDGLADPSVDQIEPFCGVGVSRNAYQDVYRLEAFHQLAQHPAIIGMLQTLFGETVFAHPRHIARLMLPAKTNAPTPPHQDYIFIQGTKTVFTCWMPLGDCPQSLGGLSVLRGSHKLGILPVRAAAGAGDRTVILDDVDQEWCQGDFQAGDALVFHSLTVHKSIPNLNKNRIRLSCDFRYQPISLPIEEKSLRPHCDVLTWDEAYAGWQSNALQYYWRKYDLDFQVFDMSLLNIQEE
jgi:ectoine hydroxylase-related dioxygenase (phytanoyl-CoA dioxygenase family)